MFEEKEEQTATCWLKEAQKGYMRIAILILLSKKSSHGYEIMKETGDRTEGFWKPTAGGIYPILKDLEKSGYIEGKWGFEKNRRRKSYSITETGRLILKRVLIKQNQIAESMKVLFEEFARDVLNLETKGLPIPKILTPFQPSSKKRSQV
ncbi:PadR family transcriptional regulator [Candidatus Bathyarchaeota archaeon]|nr:PadR family transcriptional regulator [Candidatus Bathyarchaeota archaeon]